MNMVRAGSAIQGDDHDRNPDQGIHQPAHFCRLGASGIFCTVYHDGHALCLLKTEEDGNIRCSQFGHYA
jgi:hypothetical protein